MSIDDHERLERAARLRAERKRRGWDRPEMARRLARALPGARPDLDSLVSYVKRWEAGRVGVSERYRLAYVRAFGLDDEAALFGVRSDVTVTRQGPSTLSGALGQILGSQRTCHIDSHDIDQIHRAIRQLYQLDDEQGGNRLCAVACGLLARIQELLKNASYSDRTGTALRSVAGEVAEFAGWAFFDANDQAQARHHYLEALFAAHVAEDCRLATLVLSSMSTQAYYQRHPQESLNLITAAIHSARGWATPRVRSMLALREAVGCAAVENRQAFANAAARARWEFSHDRSEADPHWVDWLSEAELTVHESICYMDLGDFQRAETLLRSALASDIGRYQRNRSLYVTWLASTLLPQGDVSGAAEVGLEALRLQADVSSSRSVAHLRSLRNKLIGHQDRPAVGDFLEQYRSVITLG
jgi:transcriptional regulator with XRE-family HTH domain